VGESGSQVSNGTGPVSRWTAAEIPALTGQVAVVTGASAGLGLETACLLAARGATVVLGCRDARRAAQAADRILASAGEGAGASSSRVRVARLDLASLASVRAAAAEISAAYSRIDLLINNAAVMRPPFRRTDDGFELTFATNHLGHFALTGLLLDRILAAARPRIVTVSSEGHRDGEMCFSDLQFERRGYHADRAYAQSKLANLLFTYELQARLRAAGAAAIALAAHPGLARTRLWRWDPLSTRVLLSRVLSPLTFAQVQSARMGALPTLRAATDPAARGGEYYGPGGRRERTGYPVLVESSARSHDVAAQRRLWEVSEQLTGVPYGLRPQPAAAG
jgi:NAD(P)-dependent dehydrogenase (short-subunit alcohol dehydrogenase family)